MNLGVSLQICNISMILLTNFLDISIRLFRFKFVQVLLKRFNFVNCSIFIGSPDSISVHCCCITRKPEIIERSMKFLTALKSINLNVKLYRLSSASLLSQVEFSPLIFVSLCFKLIQLLGTHLMGHQKL